MSEPGHDGSGLTRVYLGGVTLLLALTLSVRATAGLPHGSQLRPLMNHVVVCLMSGSVVAANHREVPATPVQCPTVRPLPMVRDVGVRDTEHVRLDVSLLGPHLMDLPPPMSA